MPADKKKLLLIVLVSALFGAGVTGGYLYFSEDSALLKKGQKTVLSEQPASHTEDAYFARIYYPSGDRLVMEERRVQRQFSSLLTAEAAIREFLKGPAAADKGKISIPAGARLLGLYQGSDHIIYVDISDEFRRNFQGDALAEFLLLKGLYESLIANMQGIDDVKLLIEGQEVESIGGHIYALYPLKDMLQESGRQ